MILRYLNENGKLKSIKNVERIVFDSLGKRNVRYRKENRDIWKSLSFSDCKEFTIVE